MGSLIPHMGLHRSLHLILKVSSSRLIDRLPRFSNLSSTSKFQTCPITSLTGSAITNENDVTHSHVHSNLSPKDYYFCFYRSNHGGVAAQSVVKDDNAAGTIVSNKIAKDVEKIFEVVSQNSDSSSVQALLDCASIELSPVLVVEVSKRFSNAGIIALSFFSWAEKQHGFANSTESYNALIDGLGMLKQFTVIWNLVCDMKGKQLLSKETFELISRRYARANKVKEAIETFEKMEEFGMTVDSSDYNKLIETFCKSKHFENAHQMFDKMRERNFVPGIKLYTSLLIGWGRDQNLARVNDVYQEMKGDGIEPDAVAYFALIDAYCQARKYDVAIELFDGMGTKNCKPTPAILCCLISSLGSEKRLAKALDIFEQYKASGCAQETSIYNALVDAYCQSTQITDAYKILDDMRKSGVPPNSQTYDIILHHLIRVGKKREADTLFQTLNSEQGVEPTLTTYKMMLKMFCNAVQVDRALRVWNHMKEKSLLPDRSMFYTLINRLCHEDKLDDACQYFQEMLDMGIRPPTKLSSNLKTALLKKGMVDTAVIFAEKTNRLSSQGDSNSISEPACQ